MYKVIGFILFIFAFMFFSTAISSTITMFEQDLTLEVFILPLLFWPLFGLSVWGGLKLWKHGSKVNQTQFNRPFASYVRIVFEGLIAISGLMMLVMAFSGLLEGFYIIVGLALLGWSVYDLQREIKDNSVEGEVSTLAQERQQIEESLKEDD